MAQHKNLYKRAVFYDIAMERDVSGEVDFVFDVYKHHKQSELGSVLEIACGPGYHARSIVRRGSRVVGLDLMEEMVELAAEKAQVEGLEVEWIAGDMRSFELNAPVDMAICMFDGIDALMENEDVVRHFRSVADNLTNGGLYLIEHTHPRECSLSDYGTYSYSGERDGVKVEIMWASNHPNFDIVSEVAQVEIEIRINDNGQKQVINDTAKERLLSPQQIRLLAEKSGVFEMAAWYGDFDLAQPLDNSDESRRMIAVLRKAG